MAAPARLIGHFQERVDVLIYIVKRLRSAGSGKGFLSVHGDYSRRIHATTNTPLYSAKGCGRGYDVVVLGLHGFDAYGLDISSTGVAAAEREVRIDGAAAATGIYDYGDENHHNNNGGPLRAPSLSPGSATFTQGDFFKSDWVNKALEDEEAKFDVIYDYTFLCALHPSMRQGWATRMADLLRSGGLLVCLEFPMYKDPTLPGPPWGLKGVHWDLLARGGDGTANIDMEAESKADDDKLGGQFERILYVKPPRSYESGKGTDMLSVYVRK
ncbi:hypothetical protein VTN00DRAFT_1444 [Thermoascus crustaceus]|uniref:uncharacterized protein n=1 Tax=Thermoascus crustaceus TaxID=5088 RepID=UPI00374426A9